jgi:hypothetical protein
MSLIQWIFACECAPRKSLAFDVKQHELIVLGVAEGDPTSHAGKNYNVIRPLRFWKGAVGETIRLDTSLEKNCGFPFQTGKTYLIFANPKEQNTVSICGRTALESEATADLKELGESICPVEKPIPLHTRKVEVHGKFLRAYNIDRTNLSVRFADMSQKDKKKFLDQDLPRANGVLRQFTELWRCADPVRKKRFCDKLTEECNTAVDFYKKQACSYTKSKVCLSVI